MITGFNTDIQFGGVTYHVQTEDKGLETPLILSLVYVGGAIIASKRTPYADLVQTGYDEGVLTERLQRQHKLICAAIRAGRVEDLKKMAEPRPPAAEKSSNGAAKEPAPAAAVSVPQPPPPAEEEDEFIRGAWEPVPPTPPVRAAEQPPPAPVAVDDWVEAAPAEVLNLDDEEDQLYLSLLEDEGEFRAGQLATIKVQVGRGPYGHRVASDASVTIKVLGTSFRPLILSTRTDHDGVAVVRAMLPRFTSGRAAIIIRAVAGADVAELRRIIHQY